MPDVTLQSGMTVGRAVRDPDEEKDDDFNVVNAAFAKFANLAWWNGERMQASMEEVKQNTELLATVNALGSWNAGSWNPDNAVSRDNLIRELGLYSGANDAAVVTYMGADGKLVEALCPSYPAKPSSHYDSGEWNPGYDFLFVTPDNPPRYFFVTNPDSVPPAIAYLTKAPEPFHWPSDAEISTWQGLAADKQLELTKIGHGLQVHLQSITTDHAKWFDGAGAVAEHQRDDQKDVLRNWT